MVFNRCDYFNQLQTSSISQGNDSILEKNINANKIKKSTLVCHWKL